MTSIGTKRRHATASAPNPAPNSALQVCVCVKEANVAEAIERSEREKERKKPEDASERAGEDARERGR